MPNMRSSLLRTMRSLGHTLRPIERVAGEVNPYLALFAVGLATLYLSCLFMLVSVALVSAGR
jgi:vacuolar-type H+-ATPase subunit I/STV1